MNKTLFKNPWSLILLCLSAIFILWLFIFRSSIFSPTDAYWNWCPEKAVSIKNHLNNKTYTSPGDIQRFCLIPYSTKTPPTQLDEKKIFNLYLSAKNEAGDQTYLELDEKKEVLRTNIREFDFKPHQLQNLL